MNALLKYAMKKRIIALLKKSKGKLPDSVVKDKLPEGIRAFKPEKFEPRLAEYKKFEPKR